MQTLNELLRELLNRLDTIAADHGEVNDTAVREEMAKAILNGFFRKVTDYRLPDKFAMFSANGNIDVMVALAFFIGNVGEVGDFNTFHKRLAAFQNESIVSDEGHNSDWFFGHWNTEDFDEDGERIDRR
jgi:hypothetical protein